MEVGRGLIIFFVSIQAPTCPCQHWFDYLHLLSVLLRPEPSQAALPALEVTPLQQFIATTTALQRRERGAEHFFHFSLLWIATYTGPRCYTPFHRFQSRITLLKSAKLQNGQEEGMGIILFAAVCNKRQSLSQETCRGVRWMYLVCIETAGPWALMELLWGSRW